MPVYIPHISTTINGKEQVTDTISADFAKRRIIHLNGEINNESALSTITQIHELVSRSSRPIFLKLNGPGGTVTDGNEIYDCMKSCSCDVYTVASGMAASMDAYLLAAGTPGKRYATPSTRIMIHQPLGGAQGQATDILIAAENIQRTKQHLAHILAEECHQPLEKLMNDMERDYWMTAQEALEYGIIDHIGDPTMEDLGDES